MFLCIIFGIHTQNKLTLNTRGVESFFFVILFFISWISSSLVKWFKALSDTCNVMRSVSVLNPSISSHFYPRCNGVKFRTILLLVKCKNVTRENFNVSVGMKPSPARLKGGRSTALLLRQV